MGACCACAPPRLLYLVLPGPTLLENWGELGSVGSLDTVGDFQSTVPLLAMRLPFPGYPGE